MLGALPQSGAHEGRGMRKLQIFGSMLLIAALGAPVMAKAQDQDDHNRNRVQDRDRDHARMPQSDRDDQGRVYDPYRRDYHAWDSNEQRYYGQWAAQHRYQNREYTQLNSRQQRNYWKWRHQQMDRDRDHDNDRH